MEFDLLSLLSVNVSVLLCIIGVTEALKKIFIKIKDNRWYLLMSFGASVLLSLFITKPFSWQDYGLSALTHFGIATIFYQYILKLIDTKIKDMKKKVCSYPTEK